MDNLVIKTCGSFEELYVIAAESQEWLMQHLGHCGRLVRIWNYRYEKLSYEYGLMHTPGEYSFTLQPDCLTAEQKNTTFKMKEEKFINLTNLAGGDIVQFISHEEGPHWERFTAKVDIPWNAPKFYIVVRFDSHVDALTYKLSL